MTIFAFYASYDINHFYVFDGTLFRCGEYQTYGGDAFTGIQNAAVLTADCVHNQSYLLKKFFTYFFLFIGFYSSFVTAQYGSKHRHEICNEENEE